VITVPLDKGKLADQIAAAFALTVPKQSEEENFKFPMPYDIAKALANAIDNYVRGGEVKGIVSEFKAGVTITGASGTQTVTATGVATQSKPVGLT